MTVFAPFRFAPIHRWVWFPEWGPLVSHDVPFADGLSGHIELEIRAETPLLVGGARRKPRSNEDLKKIDPELAARYPNGLEGEVWPYQLPDGRWAIPPSALQGMVRSILEIATFARLGPWVDRSRFGFRDISGTGTAKLIYQDRMTDVVGSKVTHRVRSGWMVRTPSGPEIVECKVARIPLVEVGKLKDPSATIAPGELVARGTALDRYKWFLGFGSVRDANRALLNKSVFLDPETSHKHNKKKPIWITYQKAFSSNGPKRTLVAGTLVLTGKPVSGMSAGHKKQEFIFHTPARQEALSSASSTRWLVAKDVWDDFELIHFEQPGRDENPNWTFWKDEYEAGCPVPIFFLVEDGGRVTTIGTAFMFKAAQPLSTIDMLRNSAPEHDPEHDHCEDLPSLIFGQVADDRRKNGLKRRAVFDTAVSVDPSKVSIKDHGPTILLGPKPSYYPIYVRQPTGSTAGTLPDVQTKTGSEQIPYATYTAVDQLYEHFGLLTPEDRHALVRPELAGVKVWPAQTSIENTGIRSNLLDKRKVQTRLRTIAGSTRFMGSNPQQGVRLRFHNLRPFELGALVWALTFGAEDAVSGKPSGRVHRIGMGKPFGFGQISIRLVDAVVIQNGPVTLSLSDRAGTLSFLIETLRTFKEDMRTAYRASGDQGPWESSAQVMTLFEAANRRNRPQLRYMPLGKREKRKRADGSEYTEFTADSYLRERHDGNYLIPLLIGGEAPIRNQASNLERASDPPSTPGGAARPTSGRVSG